MTDQSEEHQHDWDLVYDRNGTESASMSVLSAVSAALGRPPLEMAPLTDAADPDALDALFSDDDTSALRIVFDYCGCRVAVTPLTVAVEV